MASCRPDNQRYYQALQVHLPEADLKAINSTKGPSVCLGWQVLDRLARQ